MATARGAGSRPLPPWRRSRPTPPSGNAAGAARGWQRWCSSRARHDRLDELLDGGDDPFPCEVVGSLSGTPAKLPAGRTVRHQTLKNVLKRRDVARPVLDAAVRNSGRKVTETWVHGRAARGHVLEHLERREIEVVSRPVRSGCDVEGPEDHGDPGVL